MFMIFIGGIGMGAVTLLLTVKLNEHIAKKTGVSVTLEPILISGGVMLTYWGLMGLYYLRGVSNHG